MERVGNGNHLTNPYRPAEGWGTLIPGLNHLGFSRDGWKEFNHYKPSTGFNFMGNWPIPKEDGMDSVHPKTPFSRFKGPIGITYKML